MPIRGEEIRVTEEDVSAAQRGSRAADNGRAAAQSSYESMRAASLQRVKAFIRTADREELRQIRQAIDHRDPPAHANLLDRALLSLYLNITPFVLSLVFIVPLVLWVGWLYQEFRPVLVGSTVGACPPACSWGDVAFWAGMGGVSLIIALVVSYWLRGRLVKATKKG